MKLISSHFAVTRLKFMFKTDDNLHHGAQIYLKCFRSVNMLRMLIL